MGGIRSRLEPIHVENQVLSMGQLNLFVPGEGCVYVAPSLIAHYIRAHRYAPPEEFCDAVVRCPEMHSEEYLKAQRDLPESAFWDWLSRCPEPRSEEYREALRASGAEELANWIPWEEARRRNERLKLLGFLKAAAPRGVLLGEIATQLGYGPGFIEEGDPRLQRVLDAIELVLAALLQSNEIHVKDARYHFGPRPKPA